MRSLQTDLHLILQEVPQKVDDCFDQKETWPHHKPYTLKGSSGIYLKIVEDKFKEVILSTGKLLLRYKLLTEKAGSNPKWITDPTGTFVFDPRGKLPLPTAQQNEAYSKLFTEYSGLSAQRNIYSEELQQTKIKEQWGKFTADRCNQVYKGSRHGCCPMQEEGSQASQITRAIGSLITAAPRTGANVGLTQNKGLVFGCS